MNKKNLKFIEESGLLFEKFGMTRMAGRVFGYLMICDKEAVSFNEIKDVLNASKGSISGTTKNLIHAGLAEPVSLPGDRKTYYRISKIKIGDLLKARMKLFTDFAVILGKGKELKSREDDVSEWLEEASVFYQWIGDEIDRIIERWESEKEEIIASKRLE